VCLATGRSYTESVDVWRQLRLPLPGDPMVLVGGALVAEPDTGRTLYQRSIPWPAACEFADALAELGYPAMVLVDRWRHGVDYLLTDGPDPAAASRDWFSKMPVRVRELRRLADVEGGPDPLRISTVVEPVEAGHLAETLRSRFAGRLNVQDILAPNYGVMIVEAHAVEASKQLAIQYVGQSLRIGMGRAVAVGDDVNDLSMIRGAGLGVAMPKAPRVLLDAADHVAADGLADFIRRLLAGQFDPATEHANKELAP